MDESKRAVITDVLMVACEIGRHWREQEGVNGSLVDRLARLTECLCPVCFQRAAGNTCCDDRTPALDAGERLDRALARLRETLDEARAELAQAIKEMK